MSPMPPSGTEPAGRGLSLDDSRPILRPSIAARATHRCPRVRRSAAVHSVLDFRRLDSAGICGHGVRRRKTGPDEAAMRATLAMAIVPLVMTTAAEARENPLPHDVAQFVERRDLCDHFRGEPYEGDPERQRFVEQQSNRFCRGTDQQLMDLKRKYSSNPAILSRLGVYEACVEAATHCRERAPENSSRHGAVLCDGV